jgi:L-alanine-DL-glutamate epimerase-like enolase superfamily enzyme
MRIERIAVQPLRIPLRAPFVTSRATQTHAEVVLVRLTTDTGIVGLGESDPRPHITGETLAGAVEVLGSALAPAVRNEALESPEDLEALRARMDRTVTGHRSAKAGVDLAAWDALGRARKEPVHALLGPRRRERVETIGLADLTTPEQAASDAREWKERGCRAFKIKMGASAADDTERLGAVRGVLGAGVPLVADPNQAWTVRGTVERLSSWTDVLAACEQPVSADNLEGLAEVAREIPSVPLIADESVASVSDVERVVALRAASIANVKHLKSGGLTGARDVARAADAAGLGLMVGSTMETGISAVASVQLAVTVEEMHYFDVAPPTDFLLEDVVEGIEWTGARVAPPDEPGLGVRLLRDRVHKYGAS